MPLTWTHSWRHWGQWGRRRHWQNMVGALGVGAVIRIRCAQGTGRLFWGRHRLILWQGTGMVRAAAHNGVAERHTALWKCADDDNLAEEDI